jgi:hypothetical protein
MERRSFAGVLPVNGLLKNVASGLQPGAPGAQEPECTQGVHEDSETAQAQIKVAQ